MYHSLVTLRQVLHLNGYIFGLDRRKTSTHTPLTVIPPLSLYLSLRYHRAYSVNFNPHYSNCDSSCRHTHYCAITKLEFSDFRNCLETAAHALASSNNHQQRNAQLASLLLVVPVLLARLI